jgi:hypothetical protein
MMPNGYDLSRHFWDWAFENPEKISTGHCAVYFFAIEHCNRLGWKEKFGFPTQMVMDAIGIKKHQTYIKYLNELVDYGFIKMVQKSKNQFSANIISLSSAMPKKGKALDKARSKHMAKQGRSNWQSTGQSKDSIDKQENNKPINLLTIKQELLNSEMFVNDLMYVNKITKEHVLVLIEEFFIFAAEDCKDKEIGQIKKHCLYWVRKQVDAGHTLKTKQKAKTHEEKW